MGIDRAGRPTTWICTCLSTGCVFEIFDDRNYRTANACNSIKVETAGQYLSRINEELKNESDRDNAD